MISVQLTEYELAMGSLVGTRRHIEALVKGLSDKHGFDGAGWTVHCEGALGELAAGKALGRYWSGSSSTFKRGGDLGEVQVRTRSKDYYDLLVRPDDRDADVFILVTGQAPAFKVWGFIRGADAKQSEWLQTHGSRPAAYFVPKNCLNGLYDN